MTGRDPFTIYLRYLYIKSHAYILQVRRAPIGNGIAAEKKRPLKIKYTPG
jgi:hypothetical protein